MAQLIVNGTLLQCWSWADHLELDLRQAQDRRAEYSGRLHPLGLPGVGVKSRVWWRLVDLVSVVAGCGCSWWSWLAPGVQAASCSSAVSTPAAIHPSRLRRRWPPSRWSRRPSHRLLSAL